jgi:hypothetical protein
MGFNSAFKGFKDPSIPTQAWEGPWNCRRLRIPELIENRYLNVVRLSALSTGLLYPHRRYPW